MDKKTMKQYVFLVKEIEQIEAEKLNLASGLVGAVRLTDLPKGKAKVADPMAEVAVKLVDLSGLLAAKLNEAISLRISIEDAIAGLEAQERLLIRLRYVEGQSWDKIALALNYSVQHLWRLHGEILHKLEAEANGGAKAASPG